MSERSSTRESCPGLRLSFLLHPFHPLSGVGVGGGCLAQ